MASMVAKPCSSTSCQMPGLMVQEKGSRNKRKFRADPPLVDPNKIIPLPPNECTSFEFSAEKFEIVPNHGQLSECDMCCASQSNSDALKLDLGLSYPLGSSEVGTSLPKEAIEESSGDFPDADWSDLTESQLEELVLSNLDTIFRSAIKKIIASGYSEEVATKAILRSGLWYGCKDTVSNIVDNTLACLRAGQDVEPSREHYFENLQQMEKYILAELVCLLREVRPFFSTGDAMWCLLICDMNVSHACAMDSDPSGSFIGEVSSSGNPSISVQPQLIVEPKSSGFNAFVPCKSNASAAACAHNHPSEAPSLTDGPNLNPKGTSLQNGPFQEKDYQNSMSSVNMKLFSASRKVSQTTVSHEKFVVSRKASGTTRRDSILRQKALHCDKNYRSYGSKGTSRSGKLVSSALDMKLKGVADVTGINSKHLPFKSSSKVGAFELPQDSLNCNSLTITGFSSVPTFGLESNGNSSFPVSNLPSLPVADTELSLSFPAKSIPNPSPVSYNDESANCSYINSSNNRSSHGQWVPQDKKDEMIIKLAPRVRQLQNQLQEWTEWANQKVMQAARRLSKDKAELKTLRLENEEVERLKKEKQTLEDNTIKKLSEMETALGKASGQVERANTTVRRLEFENSALRREMEAAKIHAAESAASCQEVFKREKKTLMKFQSWEKQKTVLQEELVAEKNKLSQLHQRLQQAKDVCNQAEAKLNQETEAKEELVTQASSFRKEREQMEITTRSKENSSKLKAENNLQKYKDDITRLEKEISRLRLKSDSSKIAALKRGIDGSYASKVTEIRNTPQLKDSAMAYISKMVISGNGGVKRERECVMCLSEEMSVVFLPCAHQVVCTMCNELHEKQGMKECPSCRSPIQRRVCVRYARSKRAP